MYTGSVDMDLRIWSLDDYSDQEAEVTTSISKDIFHWCIYTCSWFIVYEAWDQFKRCKFRNNFDLIGWRTFSEEIKGWGWRKRWRGGGRHGKPFILFSGSIDAAWNFSLAKKILKQQKVWRNSSKTTKLCNQIIRQMLEPFYLVPCHKSEMQQSLK